MCRSTSNVQSYLAITYNPLYIVLSISFGILYFKNVLCIFVYIIKPLYRLTVCSQGSEESILHSTDFDAVRFNVIAMECEDSPSAIDINKRKMDYLVERNFTCMMVQRNCMCKHKSFVKHEIGSSAGGRTSLMIDHKRRNPTYIIPATDILKKK